MNSMPTPLPRYERGAVRWPSAHYRSGLRNVLDAASDAALGFRPKQSAASVRAQRLEAAEPTDVTWDHDSITTVAASLTGDDLVTTRRQAIAAGATALVGSALTTPLQQWLVPLTEAASPRRGASLHTAEVEALEAMTEQLRVWSNSTNSALARKAVVAQLREVIDRLREAPDGPLATRANRAAAMLADTAATMSWDAGLSRVAQRYYMLAVQLAKLGGDEGMAAGTLAALARQCYDLGQPRDGLEVVQLAQYGTRRTATPRLRAMLATREAWGYAHRGEAQAFQRAAGVAEEYFAEGVADCEPRSVRNFDVAELCGVIGARFRDLAQHDPKHARQAQEYIGRALELRRPSRLRNRAFDLIGLARAHLITSEPEFAAGLIQQALPIATPWVAGRIGAKLRDFRRDAAPFTAVAEIRESQQAISELITT